MSVLMGVGRNEAQSEDSSSGASLGEEVVRDLVSTLEKVCRWGPDFYRPGGSGGMRLVPESNDYRQIQRQVEGYWASDVRAAVVVMIQEGNAGSFVTDYQARCLSDPGLTVTELHVPPPILRRFRVESTTSFRFRARVEHLLVRIPGSRRTLPEPKAASIAAGSAP